MGVAKPKSNDPKSTKGLSTAEEHGPETGHLGAPQLDPGDPITYQPFYCFVRAILDDDVYVTFKYNLQEEVKGKLQKSDFKDFDGEHVVVGTEDTFLIRRDKLTDLLVNSDAHPTIDEIARNDKLRNEQMINDGGPRDVPVTPAPEPVPNQEPGAGDRVQQTPTEESTLLPADLSVGDESEVDSEQPAVNDQGVDTSGTEVHDDIVDDEEFETTGFAEFIDSEEGDEVTEEDEDNKE